MAAPADVTIIMPALNEAAAIADTIRALRSTLPDAELMVIDDGSTDETAALAERAGATVLKHNRNRGYGAAIRTGIKAATREFVLTCDSDGQHTPDDVKGVMDACEGDIAVGARTVDSHTPAVRIPGKWILRRFGNFLAGEKLPDLNSGLRIMRRSVILKYLHLMPTGFSFSTTSTFAFLKAQHPITWVPITVKPRQGKSSVRQWKHGPQALLLMLRLTVLFEPLKVFLTVDAGLLMLTLISLAIDLGSDLQKGINQVTVTLAIATLLVFLFGLLCDQVSAMRRELHE
jgi:glycosyltransferase involved in cell wall biosynthesis